VGRLENIIARNRRPNGLRATFGMVWRGLFLLLILGLLIFTDWALTDGGSEAPAVRQPGASERRLDGVPVLRRARTAKPAAPAAPTTGEGAAPAASAAEDKAAPGGPLRGR
jgi:hypothetical protein